MKYGAIIVGIVGGLLGLVTELPFIHSEPYRVAGGIFGAAVMGALLGAMAGAAVSFLRKN